MLLTTSDFTRQNNIIIRITVFFWLVAKAISVKLWLADRAFPVVSFFDNLSVPPLVHLILFTASIIFLIGLFVFPNRNLILMAIVIVEVSSCILDQNRWQPWEYQYILTVLILLLNRRSEKNIQSVLVFMLAGIYFYSGLSKLNPLFVQSIWCKLILSGSLGLSSTAIHSKLSVYAGFSISIIEMLFAIGLLFKRTIKWAAMLLIMMHVLILAVFGPLGLNYDKIVWPWNLTMTGYLFVLILKDPSFSISGKALIFKWNILFVILFGLMPAFNYFGCWDYFLSSSLFSSKPPDMYVCVDKRDSSFIPIRKYCSENRFKTMCDSNSAILNMRTWAFREMNVPAYPQLRVYKKMKEQLVDQYPKLEGCFYIYVYKNGKKEKQLLK